MNTRGKAANIKRKIRVSLGCLKQALICFALLQLFFAYPLHAAPSVSITVKQRIVTVQQRGIVTLPFIVSSRSTKTQILNEKIELPKGWRMLAQKGAFTLAPNARSLRLVHALAPSDVPAGKYSIPYHVLSKDKLTVLAEEQINVVIRSTSKLVINTLEKPEMVLAGEDYLAKVRVENKGNSPLSLNININDVAGYLTTFEPRQLKLAPSEDGIVTVKSTIPADLKESLSHTLKLSFRGRSVSEDKTISTRIISRTPVGTGLYHSLPTTISSSYIDDGSKSALQAEIAVKGSLDEKGEHYLDLLYRDDWTSVSSPLANGSEQRLTYQFNNVAMYLGDRTVPLAGITDNGFYGRGAELSYHPANRNWTARAFSVKKRPEEEDGDTSTRSDMKGFEVGYQFNENVEFAFNMISSNDANNSQKNERIAGLEFHWDKHTEAEINFSLAKDKDGNAFQFEQNGSLGALSYDLEIARADTGFDGRINDVERQILSGVYQVNDRNYLRANLFHSRRNLQKDIRQRIPEEKNINVGVGHYFNKNMQHSFYAELFFKKIEDKRDESDLNYTEQGIRLDYNKLINQKFELNAVFEYVQENNKIKLEQSDKTRGSLTLAYTPSEKFYFGFNVDSSLVNNDSDYNAADQLSYGFNASVNFNESQRLSGYWRYSKRAEKSSQNLHIGYHHTFQNGMALGASVSTDLLQDNTDELSYQLRLSVPFDTPIYKYKNIASVAGKITDHSTQQPIPNTVVGIAGQYAVSDESGGYRFKAVREGEYQVTTDLSRTDNSNYFLEDEKYQKVSLMANQANVHDIALVAGTGVSGQVLNHAVHRSPAAKMSLGLQDKAALKPIAGVSGLLITMVDTEDDSKVYKTLTNEGGYFHFNGVKPGQWRILASDPDGVMKEGRLVETQRIVNLKVGEEKKVTFNVIPLIKVIKKIGPSSGFNVSSE